MSIAHRNKIEEIEPLLDRIVLKNDQILLWQQRREAVLNDGNKSSDDMEIGNIIKRLETAQQDCAASVADIDNRGTVRVRMLCDAVRTMADPHVPNDIKRLIKNRVIIMGLIPIYRLKTPKQTKLITDMLGKLPTTGRDYSRFYW